jgi:outer membrane receptor protein involved in Fe transport
MGRWGGRAVLNTVGLQLRNDNVSRVSLSHTQARQLIDLVRQDSVLQTSAGLYVQSEVQWTPRIRTLAGARADGFRFDVNSGDPRNAGIDRAGLVSPKGGMVIGPFKGTELYVNGGYGFHSNDARGTTMTVDPSTGEAVERVTPLVRAKGAELGLRTIAIPRLQTSLALWSLSLASELVFVGDAGTTQSGRPSHRYGVEWQNYYRPRPWLSLDGDVSISRARFTDANPAGTRVPGSVEAVLSGGVTVDSLRNVFGSMRLRYFGPRSLTEDDLVRSKSTRLVNAEVGYRFSQRVRAGIDVFNLLNAAHSDIDYFYRSRLPGEPGEGVDDIHFHPTLPRTARVSLTLSL